MLRSATGCFCAPHRLFVGMGASQVRTSLTHAGSHDWQLTPPLGASVQLSVGATSLPPASPLALMRSHCGRSASIYRALGQRTGRISSHGSTEHERLQALREQMGSGDGEGL